MSATQFDVQVSQAQTASGNGGNISVGGFGELAITVSVTTATGTTTPLLSVFMQSSDDGGVTWYDLPYEMALISASTTHTEGDHRVPDIAAASGSAKIGARNILDQFVPASAPAKAFAVYRTFGALVRAAWVMSGASLSYTFGIKCTAK